MSRVTTVPSPRYTVADFHLKAIRLQAYVFPLRETPALRRHDAPFVRRKRALLPSEQLEVDLETLALEYRLLYVVLRGHGYVRSMPNSRRLVLQLQATYYVATGVWPLLSRKAFERVTGPKVDWWLVQMVGLLAASIGTSIAVGARDERPAPLVRTLAALTAASFAAIDVVYVARRRISPIYLCDAAAEAGFIALLLR